MVKEDSEAPESRTLMPVEEQRHHHLLVELPDEPSVDWARRLLQDVAITPDNIELVGTNGQAVSTRSGISAEEGVAGGMMVRRVITGAAVGVVLGGIIGAIVANLAGGDQVWAIICGAIFALFGGVAAGVRARRGAVESAHPELAHPVLDIRAATPEQLDRAQAALREVETIRTERRFR